MKEPSSRYGCGSLDCEACSGDKEWQEAQMDFQVKWNTVRDKWEIVQKDGITVEGFTNKEDAEDAALLMNYCQHETGYAVEIDGTEITIYCEYCGRSAGIGVPVNLEWSL